MSIRRLTMRSSERLMAVGVSLYSTSTAPWAVAELGGVRKNSIMSKNTLRWILLALCIHLLWCNIQSLHGDLSHATSLQKNTILYISLFIDFVFLSANLYLMYLLLQRANSRSKIVFAIILIQVIKIGLMRIFMFIIFYRLWRDTKILIPLHLSTLVSIAEIPIITYIAYLYHKKTSETV